MCGHAGLATSLNATSTSLRAALAAFHTSYLSARSDLSFVSGRLDATDVDLIDLKGRTNGCFVTAFPFPFPVLHLSVLLPWLAAAAPAVADAPT